MKSKLIGYYNYTVIATYAALTSGIFGIFSAFEGKTFFAVICLMVSGILDMFDGRIAATKERSDDEKKFGIQIDSLCDLVSFGVLPAAIGYSLGLDNPWFMLLFTLFVLNAKIRLAFFNVDEMKRQNETTEKRKFYTGLPVTMSAAIFPTIYVFASPFGDTALSIVYAAFLLICAVLFVVKVKLPKAGTKMMIAFLVLGVAMIACLVAFRMTGIIGG